MITTPKIEEQPARSDRICSDGAGDDSGVASEASVPGAPASEIEDINNMKPIVASKGIRIDGRFDMTILK